jgi:periplasmic protein TonB
MSIEEKGNSAEQIGTLGSCLIEGDPEQKSRERRVKRRAMVLSIMLQAAVLVALVLVPLLGRTERLPFSIVTPMPPYRAPHQPAGDERTTTPPIRHGECVACFTHLSSRPATQSGLTSLNIPTTDGIDIGNSDGIPAGASGLEGLDGRKGPAPPEDPNRNQKRRISVGGAVQQAMLIHRVEPTYPPLARQLRLSGQVHLRAIISADGAVESLQVMDGSPLLVKSAMDAVGQWRYQPTKLNGQPVEVETIITVIYSLNQ